MPGETMSLVGTYAVSSDTNTFTISGIPQTGDDLYVLLSTVGDTASNGDGRVAIYPNGDTANMWHVYQGSGGGTSVFRNMANTYIPLGLGSIPDYGPTSAEFTIFNYSSGSLTKSISWESYMLGHRAYLGSGNWFGTAAVTSLGFQVRDLGTVLKSGTIFTLYTIKRGIGGATSA